jgi:DNA polymerase-3 subunit alpha
MAAQRDKFLAGCAGRKVPAKKAEKIFDLMEEFGRYGFPKAHSCAYALLAYRSAWLKAHYRIEFMTAGLISETGDRDKLTTYLRECREIGIRDLPPHVNHSAADFHPEESGIRWGLAAIKGVGNGAANVLIRSRQKCGPFSTFWQFCKNTDAGIVNKRVIEGLIKAGALDSLGLKREQMMAVVGNSAFRAWRRSRVNENQDFSMQPGNVPPSLAPLLTVAGWSRADELSHEREVLGVYVSGNPLDSYRAQLGALRTIKTSDLGGLADNVQVAVAGVLTEFKALRSRKNNLWAKGILEDRTGSISLLLFAEAIELFRDKLHPGKVLIVKGRVRRDAGRETVVLVNDVKELSQV